jgi:glycosyltransferase involved in cell wall biosynthesis
MKKLLFYTDTDEYGGHEALTLEAAQFLAKRKGMIVAIVFFAGNDRLRRELEKVNRYENHLRLYPLNLRSRNLQSLRTLLSFRKINRLSQLFLDINPDAIVVSQGRIEASSMGLLAAKASGIPTISYIPMAHCVSTCGRKFLAGTRDKINAHFYSLPDRIITISHSSRDMLLARGAGSNISVVCNGIQVPFQNLGKIEARLRLGLPNARYVVAIVGRIDFRQKAQDFALRALYDHASELKDVTFCFVGTGPDERRLKQHIVYSHLSENALVLSWREDPSLIYAAADMLLIPSRFEGVPLVMLEAMACGLPVVASRLDGMAEVLPSCWLFPPGDGAALVRRLSEVRGSSQQDLINVNRNRVAQEFTLSKFQTAFADAVLGFERPDNCSAKLNPNI